MIDYNFKGIVLISVFDWKFIDTHILEMKFVIIDIN